MPTIYDNIEKKFSKDTSLLEIVEMYNKFNAPNPEPAKIGSLKSNSEKAVKEFYTEKELQTIILRSAEVLNVEIEPNGALEMAKRSRGTPRLANRLLKRVRDFAQVKFDGKITKERMCICVKVFEVNAA